ncbi:hypothetical protein ACFOTA_08475 [Chitinophaga sp. GCM10012297]|uniref:Uncharacterized protein n=1 Tax=Chitinophaga chungangae TaxID=2821488 RepID=A0ABS3YC32_9BACT|nr:hypothetical protein [Chitinophaga chungangae]MBO9152238.1 hypothetical protein [Chitinophaga chungangae]
MKKPIEQPDPQKAPVNKPGPKPSTTGDRIKKDNPEGTDQEGGLTKEDLPDSTNTSTGVPGTGQRQDSN